MPATAPTTRFVSDSIYWLDPAKFPPPKSEVLLLNFDNVQTRGIFDPRYFKAWFPFPNIPQHLKGNPNARTADSCTTDNIANCLGNCNGNNSSCSQISDRQLRLI